MGCGVVVKRLRMTRRKWPGRFHSASDGKHSPEFVFAPELDSLAVHRMIEPMGPATLCVAHGLLPPRTRTRGPGRLN